MRPAPVAKTSAKSTLVAERISRALMVSGVRLGSFSSISATAPETTAAAMLVPESW